MESFNTFKTKYIQGRVFMVRYYFDIEGHTIVEYPACFRNAKECPYPDNADEMCVDMSKCQDGD